MTQKYDDKPRNIVKYLKIQANSGKSWEIPGKRKARKSREILGNPEKSQEIPGSPQKSQEIPANPGVAMIFYDFPCCGPLKIRSREIPDKSLQFCVINELMLALFWGFTASFVHSIYDVVFIDIWTIPNPLNHHF